MEGPNRGLADRGGEGVTTLLANIKEEAFEDLVIEYARLRGWLVHVERRARSEKGWRTPIKGDAGFPDLVLARAGQLVLVELKAQKGRVSAGQSHWLDALNPRREGLPFGNEVHVWRPSDWPEIMEALR